MEKNRQPENLLRYLQNDLWNVFYTTNKISKNLLKKVKSASYNKDKAFYNQCKELDDKEFVKNKNLTPLLTPYIKKRSNIDRFMLYGFSKPFKSNQADIADLRFLVKSAVDSKYCFLFVDLFTSKIYVYPMKKRSLLAKKVELFYNDIKDERAGRMQVQTDKEFNQNKIKNMNKDFDVEMYQINLRGGKAFTAEQNILLRSKRFEKLKKNKMKPNELIKKAAQNMNNIISPKYGIAPEKTEQKSLDPHIGEHFKEVYDYVRLKTIKDNKDRLQNFDEKLDKRKKSLRNPLNNWEKVLVLAERLKKKDASGKLYKSKTKNKSLFNRDKLFTSTNLVKLNNCTYLYWLKEGDQKVKGRFLRQEWFVLNDQLK